MNGEDKSNRNLFKEKLRKLADKDIELDDLIPRIEMNKERKEINSVGLFNKKKKAKIDYFWYRYYLWDKNHTSSSISNYFSSLRLILFSFLATFFYFLIYSLLSFFVISSIFFGADYLLDKASLLA